MRKLTSIFCGLAMVAAASVASADTITISGPGTFGSIETFNFPEALGTINSVTIDLTYADSGTVAQRPLVLSAGPAGAQIIYADNPSGALSGTYTFVESGGADALLGGNSTAAGTVNAVNWSPGSPPPQFGWNLQFIGDASGTYENISIDFTPASAVPEPSSALAILGLAGFAIARRRR